MNACDIGEVDSRAGADDAAAAAAGVTAWPATGLSALAATPAAETLQHEHAPVQKSPAATRKRLRLRRGRWSLPLASTLSTESPLESAVGRSGGLGTSSGARRHGLGTGRELTCRFTLLDEACVEEPSSAAALRL